jgi:hypothetical protein
MWTTNFVYNIIDAGAANLIVAAGDQDVTAEVSYLGAKAGGGGVITIAGVVDIVANSTNRFAINLADPAFAGGYGAVRVRSIVTGTAIPGTPGTPGTPANTSFFGYSAHRAPIDANPVSSTAFQGSAFRLPLLAQANQAVKLAITNVSTALTNVQVRKPVPGGWNDAQDLPPDTTWLWDSVARGRSVVENGQIEIVSPGVLVVSAFVTRPNADFHVHLPVQA